MITIGVYYHYMNIELLSVITTREIISSFSSTTYSKHHLPMYVHSMNNQENDIQQSYVTCMLVWEEYMYERRVCVFEKNTYMRRTRIWEEQLRILFWLYIENGKLKLLKIPSTSSHSAPGNRLFANTVNSKDQHFLYGRGSC